MAEQEGVVLETQGQFVLISPHRGVSSCGSCAPTQGCGVARIAQLFGARQPGVRAFNGIGAQVGDRVVVSLPDDALLKTSLMVYGLPLATMLIFLVVADVILRAAAVTNADPWLILACTIGFIGSVAFLRHFNQLILSASQFQPTVSRITARA